MVQGIASLDATQNQNAAPVSGSEMDQDTVMALGKAFSSLSQQEISELKELADELKSMSKEQLSALGQILTFVKSKQDQYPKAVQTLIKQGLVEPGDLPPKYIPAFFEILESLVKQAMAEGPSEKEPMSSDLGQENPQGFARGGIASLKSSASRVAQHGRKGDTMVAHLSPRSVSMLKDMGGSGTINPATGLREYSFFSSIGNFFKKAASIVLPIALSIPFGPIVGGALGSGLGALINGAKPSQALQAALIGGAGGALFSGASSMLQGKGFMEGVVGGLPTGMQGMFGGAAPASEGVTTPATSAQNYMGGSDLAGYKGSGNVAGPASPVAASAAPSGISSLFGSIQNSIQEHPYWWLGGAGLAGMAMSNAMQDEAVSPMEITHATEAQIRAAQFPEGSFKVRRAPVRELVPTYSPAYAADGGEIDARIGGHLEGPGTGTSDSIPAKLSDGEFVMTAKAVRGAGGGSREKGARRMYDMMHQFEKRA